MSRLIRALYNVNNNDTINPYGNTWKLANWTGVMAGMTGALYICNCMSLCNEQ